MSSPTHPQPMFGARLVYLNMSSNEPLVEAPRPFPMFSCCTEGNNPWCKNNRWCCFVRTLQICLVLLLVYCLYSTLRAEETRRAPDSSDSPRMLWNARKPLGGNLDYDTKAFSVNVNVNVVDNATLPSFKSLRSKVLMAPKQFCAGDQVDIVILVHSRPSNIGSRKSIRKTWGGIRKLPDGRSLSLIFVMGLSFPYESYDYAMKNSRIIDEMTRHEAVQYQDVLLGDFHDIYHHLSIKHELGLRWLTQHCPRTSLIFKADDDAFVDVYGLFSFLDRTLETPHPTSMIACDVIPAGTEPKRAGKWAVSVLEYPKAQYPQYCSGLAYVMSMDVAKAIIQKAAARPWLWVDDVWVTGLLVEDMEIRYILLNARYCYDLEPLQSWLAATNASSSVPCTVAHLDARNSSYSDILNEIWQHVQAVR
ncbi:beta-1,3-galactosyltransferase 5-like [Hyalella azteca]|uniref:Hexosyltransferase n=1 Tax=Hyalella azteca TaxID=294128 RepID=A0A8B7NXW0_HYAAZ|nr:beta-1,3-galactosyltransferase 5-like [Hyalella azteca]